MLSPQMMAVLVATTAIKGSYGFAVRWDTFATMESPGHLAIMVTDDNQ